ncbi:phenylacetate--CoA ligase family protein [Sinorhizobium meliloti]|uniref:phenylacetate--CoA ligase family protein n=1 Tax=Rhizobium meliloti TaxID=382 RepID=UPI000FDA7F20|nr:phenylacetate--CoA ligase family protein [Sinorhizobium meliloti]RVO59201.1 phenylacetate--CoA ligase family protein [Sinorhizobium meliloti]
MTEHAVGLIWDAWRTRKRGAGAIAQRQRARLADVVAYARANSPYYGELYRGLPDRVENAGQLPVTDKKMLMGRFDEWCTDRAVTLEAAEALVDDPNRIGEWFLGKYTVMTTSGTTGRRGIFLVDARTMAVVTAMMLRWVGDWLSPSDFLKIISRRGRTAMVMATGGHFASAVAAARLKKRRGKQVEVLSAHMPMTELVARLNRFQPAMLAPYASMAAMLADEQEAGRLGIHPVLLALSAEGLPQEEYGRIARVFNAKVGNSYAASECMFLSSMCREGWLHVNADWVAFEPVDADYRPVAPGEQSHTVLISNLANRVQPILRYDLGDSVLQRPDPCPCGNPLPAIRVQGRSADVLMFRNSSGDVRLPPLALTQRIEAVRGITLFQLAQTAPATLEIRLQIAPTANADTVWREAEAGLRKVLAEHGLENVVVERGGKPPEQGRGGKFREVIPLKEGTHS